MLLSTFTSVWIWHALVQRQDMVPWSIYFVPSVAGALILVAIMWSIPSQFGSLADELIATGRSALLTTLVLMALSFFLQSDAYSRGTLLVFVPVLIVGLLLADRIDRWLSTTLMHASSASRRVLLVGYGDHGQIVAQSLANRPAYYSLIGYLDRRGVVHPEDDLHLPKLGATDDLASVLANHTVDEVIIVLGDATEHELQDLIGICMAVRIRWKVMPPMLELRLDQVRFDTVGGLPVVGPRGSKLVGYHWYLKRLVDLAGSLTLLLVLSPILVLAALGVMVTSRGPIIYRQARIGLRGQPFTMYKFRSMTVSNDEQVHETAAVAWVYGDGYSQDHNGDVMYKNASDSRITSVGKVLRATSIDELPQLWNVAKGDMSLVGPRPPIDYEVAQYTEKDKRRLEVPPGVTGLWQVSGRSSLSFEEMVDLDLDYIDNWSVGLDVSILLRTLPAVVVDRGK